VAATGAWRAVVSGSAAVANLDLWNDLIALAAAHEIE
jgi:hypothetical protein